MAKKKIPNKKSNDDKTLFAFIASFFTIIGFIIALAIKKDDKYVMFYAKHGLVLFITQIIVGFIFMIPIIGWFLIGPILWIFWLVLWLITWINALSGKTKKTFIIGDLAEKFDF